MKKILLATAVGVAAVVPIVAHPAEETTIYLQATIPLDKGKPTVNGGISQSQTRGDKTTKVDVNTNGKTLTVTGSQTQRR